MSPAHTSTVTAEIVETDVQFTLQELGHVCSADITLLEALVHEGVLTPRGDNPQQWRFAGSTLPRARTAARLMRELELDAHGAAVVLGLFEEIEALRSQLRRLQG